MRKLRIFGITFALLASCIGIQSKPVDIAQMSGWYKIFNEEFGYLSPFHGCVWFENGMIERMMLFGNAKTTTEAKPDRIITKFVSGDATIKLLYQLFHFEGETLNTENSPSSAGKYLDAAAIAKIITWINSAMADTEKMQKFEALKLYKLQQSQQQKDRSSKISYVEFINRVFGQTLDSLTTTKAQLESQIGQTPTDNELRKKLALLKKDITLMQEANANGTDLKIAKEKLTSEIEKLEEDITILGDKIGRLGLEKVGPDAKIKKVTEKPEQVLTKIIQETVTACVVDPTQAPFKKKALQDASQLATTIIESLKESGDLPGTVGELKYVPYTPIFILLAFIYAKINGIDEFQGYIANLPDRIVKKDWENILQKTHFDPSITPAEWSYRFGSIDASKKTDKQRFIIDNYEEICLSEIYRKLHGSSKIDFKFIEQFSSLPINKNNDLPFNAQLSFTNCVEVAVFNWFLVIRTKLGLDKDWSPQNCYDKLIHLFIQNKVLIDEAILWKKATILSELFEKFHIFSTTKNTDSILEFHVYLTKLFSNLDGVRYLQRVKEETAEKNEDKNYNFVHPLEHDDVTVKYGKFTMPCDTSFYLCELAGYPGTFVAITNYFLGTNCSDFFKLCNFFGIEYAPGQGVLTDKDIMAENIGRKIILNIGIAGENTKISLNVSKAHSKLALLEKEEGRETIKEKALFTDNKAYKVLRTLDKHISYSYIYLNILTNISNYSTYVFGYISSPTISKFCKEGFCGSQFIFFTQNFKNASYFYDLTSYIDSLCGYREKQYYKNIIIERFGQIEEKLNYLNWRDYYDGLFMYVCLKIKDSALLTKIQNKSFAFLQKLQDEGEFNFVRLMHRIFNAFDDMASNYNFRFSGSDKLDVFTVFFESTIKTIKYQTQNIEDLTKVNDILEEKKSGLSSQDTVDAFNKIFGVIKQEFESRR